MKQFFNPALQQAILRIFLYNFMVLKECGFPTLFSYLYIYTCIYATSLEAAQFHIPDWSYLSSCFSFLGHSWSCWKTWPQRKTRNNESISIYATAHSCFQTQKYIPLSSVNTCGETAAGVIVCVIVWKIREIVKMDRNVIHLIMYAVCPLKTAVFHIHESPQGHQKEIHLL